jgi:putative inorganic carbon (HCO3(-)) transporter
MIDWLSLLKNICWIGGLALVMAGCNLAVYCRRVTNLPFSKALAAGWHSAATRAGRLLFCLGMGGTSPSWPLMLFWGLLAASVGYEWWRQPSKKLPFSGGFNLAARIPATGLPGFEDIFLERKPGRLELYLRRLGDWLECTRPLWLLALLPGFVTGEGHYLLYSLVALLVLWGTTGLLSGQWGRKFPADWALLVWLIVLPLAVIISISPALTGEYLGYFLAELSAFYGLLTWARTPRRVTRSLWGLVATGSGLALLTPFLIQRGGRFFLLPAALPQLPLLPAGSVNRNVLAGTLAIILPLAFGLLLNQLDTTRKTGFRSLRLLGALSFVVIISGGLILTQSRAALAGVAVGLGLMLALKWGRGWWLLTLPVLVLLLAGLVVANPHLLNLVLSSETLAGGLDQRLEVWSRAINAIERFPLSGVGLGTAKLIMPALTPWFLASSPDPAALIPHAHNLFLQIGLDLGLPGLIAFLTLLISLVRLVFARWRNTRNSAFGWLVSGGLGSLCVLLAQGMVDAVAWGTKPAFLVWAVLGFLYALSLLPQNPSSIN